MSLGNKITEKLNSIEVFIQNSPTYFFPIKILGWIVLFLALMVTNLLAVIKWPFSAVFKRLKKKERAPGEPINISSESELSKIIANTEIVLLDFWAEWCGPCLLMNDAINYVAQICAHKVTVVKVDVSLNSKLSNLYSVRGLPTVIVFKNSHEVVRKSGSLTKTQLSEMVEKV